tara:strand:+ start:380 stop:910 length:531 start_codon:yes stop_codon:yes gene_type:complete
MKTIQSFIEKHNGNYTQEVEKSVNTHVGKYSSQAKIGSLIYKGSKLKIAINEVGGADPISQPLRIKLYLDKPILFDFFIFPRSYWNQKIRSVFGNKKISLIKSIKKQYSFSGSNKLTSKLIANESFLQKIDNEIIVVNISKKKPNVITIIPTHGYRNVEHLEKLADILKLIESEIE